VCECECVSVSVCVSAYVYQISPSRKIEGKSSMNSCGKGKYFAALEYLYIGACEVSGQAHNICWCR